MKHSPSRPWPERRSGFRPVDPSAFIVAARHGWRRPPPRGAGPEFGRGSTNGLVARSCRLACPPRAQVHPRDRLRRRRPEQHKMEQPPRAPPAAPPGAPRRTHFVRDPRRPLPLARVSPEARAASRLPPIDAVIVRLCHLLQERRSHALRALRPSRKTCAASMTGAAMCGDEFAE